MTLRFAPYSHTRLSTATRCLHQFDHKYIRKTTPAEWDTTLRDVGRAFSEWKQQYIEHLIASEQQTDWLRAEELKREAVAPYPAEVADEASWLIDKCAQHYILPKSAWQNCNELAVELKVAFDFDGKLVPWDDPTAVIRGVMDYCRVYDGVAYIEDDKTGHVTDLRPDQLRTYALFAVLLHDDVEEVVITYRYWRTGEADTWEVSRVDALEWWEHLRVKIAWVESRKEFPASPGRQCAWCPFFHVCESEPPVSLVTNEGVTLTTDAAITKFVGQMEMAKTLYDRMLEVVKPIAEVRPVVVNGYRYDYRRQESMKLTPAKVRKLARLAGKDPEKYLKVDVAKARRLPGAERHAERTTQRRWGSWREKE